MWHTVRTVGWFIPAVTLYTIVCGSVSFVLAVLFRSGGPSHQVARFWAWLILKTCGVKVSISGLENLDSGQIYVFASNHQSLFDIPILFVYLPFSFRILYKKSLNRIPFLGWHLFMSGHIGVDRANPVRARKSLEHAAERIRKMSVAVFPEGTRSSDGSLGRFKYGSFLLAVRAGVSIVPVTIFESWRVMKRGDVTVHPGTVRVRVDRPLSVAGLDEQSASKLAKTVREVVKRNSQPDEEHNESAEPASAGR
jgi:1-acyl-sn-glycerol-3-phosphate acyltransferase